MDRLHIPSTALILLALATTSRPAAAAWPHDPHSGNVALCTAAGDQQNPTSVPDGTGGMIVAWEDLRSGTADVYVQRLNAAGVPQWTASGVALCTATGPQIVPTLVSDGAGGAIVTWQDHRGSYDDIYAQRISAVGVPQWTANGVALCTAAYYQQTPAIVSDDAGGAIVTWQDLRGAGWDVYAQRVNAAGATQWTADGVALCTATGDQLYPTLVADGAGGLIATWQDTRGGLGNDIYAQRLNAAGAAQWTANGVALCTVSGEQQDPTIVTDGASGAIVSWQDGRNGYFYTYVQRISAAGGPQWQANGLAVGTAGNYNLYPMIVSDGAGGAILAWENSGSSSYNIYVQRVSAAGVAQWTANGVALCTALGDQTSPKIVADGAGGAIVTWQDGRGASQDIYAQRIGAAGAPLWTYDGVALCLALDNQYGPTIVSDGAGGALVTWYDHRSTTNYDIYAQRLERFGYLGSPEPAIVNVKDYPNDQGGKVRIAWNASYLDADPSNAVGSYYVWRQAPPFAVASALQGGTAQLLREGQNPAKAGRRVYRVAQTALGPYYWEYLATQPAQGFPGYSYVAATGSDSVAAGNPVTRYMIEAVSNFYSVPTAHWSSAADSGYSVDNLPPAAPAPFSGQYAAGTTHLHWDRNRESDLAGYRLYRGTGASFVPDPSNLLAALADTGYADAVTAAYVYKLTAVDSHGNESAVATLIPQGTLGVGDTPPLAFGFSALTPNPARGVATLDFTLSRAGRVRLAVYDDAGRRVQVLRDGELAAGAHRESVTLHDATGRSLASGLYVVRLEAEDHVLTRRLAVIR